MLDGGIAAQVQELRETLSAGPIPEKLAPHVDLVTFTVHFDVKLTRRSESSNGQHADLCIYLRPMHDAGLPPCSS